MREMKRMLVVVLLFVVTVVYAFADVPNEITYQGRLREYGQSVSGTRTMNFKIYNTASDTGLVWESGNMSVVVATGTFSCILNPGVDWRQKDYWIETTVSGKVLSPREKITSQVYALHARTAEDILKSEGSSINFIIGVSTKATIAGSGELKSLVSGTTFYMVPRGAIIMWSGTIASIPSGWALCDGSNGTPDLRDRFVMSVANSSENPGGTGGAANITLVTANLPSHSHAFTTDSAGVHAHSINRYDNSISPSYGQTMIDSRNGGSLQNQTATESAGAHTHTGTTNNTGSNIPLSILPPYYKVAFIMKL